MPSIHVTFDCHAIKHVIGTWHTWSTHHFTCNLFMIATSYIHVIHFFCMSFAHIVFNIYMLSAHVIYDFIYTCHALFLHNHLSLLLRHSIRLQSHKHISNTYDGVAWYEIMRYFHFIAYRPKFVFSCTFK